MYEKKKNYKKDENNDKFNKKIYDNIIGDDFLFGFEKEEKDIFKKYSIKYYILKKNKIIELKQK